MEIIYLFYKNIRIYSIKVNDFCLHEAASRLSVYQVLAALELECLDHVIKIYFKYF